MRREDYERMEPKKYVRQPEQAIEGAEGLIMCIGGVAEEPGQPEHFCLEIDLPGFPLPVMVPIRTKEDADEIIRCLISARNKTWPTP